MLHVVTKSVSVPQDQNKTIKQIKKDKNITAWNVNSAYANW